MNGQSASASGQGGPAVPGLPPAPLHEIALVLGVPTTLFLAACVAWNAPGAGRAGYTDTGFLFTLGEEVTLAALLLPLLRRRGWTPTAIAGRPEAADVLRGVLVAFASLVAYNIALAVQIGLFPASGAALVESRVGGQVSEGVALATALINPLFEEFLWLGYGVSALKPRIGLLGACLASIALRTAIHAYQGPAALVGIAALGVVFTSYYARSGRLWPLVVAHVILDAAALGSLRR